MLKDGSPESYSEAALRHYADALRLREAGRTDNAGHLIGFAVECAIKHRMEMVGQIECRQHLPDLLPAARKQLGSRKSFVGMYNLIKGEVLSGWSVDHRYSADEKVTPEIFQEWERDAKRLLAAAGLKMRAQ